MDPMKKIGIIGGMSWESTQHYYKIMNEKVAKLLGGHASIEAILYSINFERLLRFVILKDWKEVARIILEIAQILERAGADFILLTANAIHKVFPEIETKLQIPILHIADPTGEAIVKKKMKKVGLLGTQITMEDPFYQHRLNQKFGLECMIPEKSDRKHLHKIIFEELTIGKIVPSSKNKLLSMIDAMRHSGAEGVILGCTELTLILHQNDTNVTLFDTTQLHADAAVSRSIGREFL